MLELLKDPLKAFQVLPYGSSSTILFYVRDSVFSQNFHTNFTAPRYQKDAAIGG